MAYLVRLYGIKEEVLGVRNGVSKQMQPHSISACKLLTKRPSVIIWPVLNLQQFSHVYLKEAF